MSGHSKWAQIKHKKAITDAKKAKIFSKISRLLTIAAKEKGPDPSANAKLRTVIEKAKAANMPNDNIDRAIKKATSDDKILEEITIEAYGPSGIALIIEAITDNKNRTNQETRKILTKYNGKLANEGSVRWLFDYVGAIEILNTQNREQAENIAIENDAIDIKEAGDKILIYTAPDKLHQTKNEFEKNGVAIADAYLDYVPKNYVELDASAMEQIEKLYEELDDNDDIQEIYSNIKE